MRVGHGYDVHKLVPGRKLVIGGVEVPCELGLIGHSDADVLLHAIMDALIGAAGLGDIGRHFPENDDNLRGISSLILLEKVVNILSEKKYKIVNIDSLVVLQFPKICEFIPRMVENVAKVCKIDSDRINVKATTEEKLGFTGKREGVAAHAVCLID